MTSENRGNATRDALTSKDADLFGLISRDLYTAVLSDAMDELGVRDRVMRERLRPLHSDSILVGRARTVLSMDLYHVQENPYAKEIEVVDSILPGEIVVVSTSESTRNAPWGELLSTAAAARGARGAVVDGLVRDVKKIISLGFPVFAAGIKPVDSKGRGVWVDCNVPVECGGVSVHPGDLIVGDFDGVVAIPAGIVDEVVQLAADKASRESNTRSELMAGSRLREIYDKYGVL